MSTVHSPVESRDVSSLMRRIAHDLRTPLGSISIWLHLIKNTTDPAERAEAQSRIEEAVAAAARCANELTGWAGLFEADLASRRIAVGIGSLVRDAVNAVRVKAAAPGVDIEASPAGEEARIEAEPEQFTRALEVLLTHAARDVPPGGRLGVRLEADADSVRLEVPLGAAAGPALRPLAHAIADRTGGESSLALSLAWEIVAIHGGRMIHHAAPEGGILTLRIPRVAP